MPICRVIIKCIPGGVVRWQASPLSYLSCSAKAGGIIFVPILPMRVGNTPTSSTTVTCRRSRPHWDCWVEGWGGHNSRCISMATGDLHAQLPTQGQQRSALPTPNCPEDNYIRVKPAAIKLNVFLEEHKEHSEISWQ